jgi:hypothetical protein
MTIVKYGTLSVKIYLNSSGFAPFAVQPETTRIMYLMLLVDKKKTRILVYIIIPFTNKSTVKAKTRYILKNKIYVGPRNGLLQSRNKSRFED